jgi:hypothetical protein
MTRTQIQLPDPLFKRLRSIAKAKDLSLAEIIRRQMEKFVETFPENLETPSDWKYPVLPRSPGPFLCDPATVNCEAEAIEAKGLEMRGMNHA